MRRRNTFQSTHSLTHLFHNLESPINQTRVHRIWGTWTHLQVWGSVCGLPSIHTRTGAVHGGHKWECMCVSVCVSDSMMGSGSSHHSLHCVCTLVSGALPACLCESAGEKNISNELWETGDRAKTYKRAFWLFFLHWGKQSVSERLHTIFLQQRRRKKNTPNFYSKSAGYCIDFKSDFLNIIRGRTAALLTLFVRLAWTRL